MQIQHFSIYDLYGIYNLYESMAHIATASMILYGVYHFYQSRAQLHYSNYSVYGLLWLLPQFPGFADDGQSAS